MVPDRPMAEPVIRKMRSTEPRLAPMVRRMAMSWPLSLTSMVMPETMLSAATSTISVRIMNMTLRSTSRAEKKVTLRWRQSEISTGRPAALVSRSLVVPMSSGFSTNTSMALTLSSMKKNFCASASGRKTKVLSYSLMPILKMELTG